MAQVSFHLYPPRVGVLCSAVSVFSMGSLDLNKGSHTWAFYLLRHLCNPKPRSSYQLCLRHSVAWL